MPNQQLGIRNFGQRYAIFPIHASDAYGSDMQVQGSVGLNGISARTQCIQSSITGT